MCYFSSLNFVRIIREKAVYLFILDTSLIHLVSSTRSWTIKPNTHRRRRRDSALQLRCVGSVYWAWHIRSLLFVLLIWFCRMLTMLPVPAWMICIFTNVIISSFQEWANAMARRPSSVRLSVCKLLRKSLLLADKWPDRHQTGTRWTPGQRASRVCSRSRSRSKITWYGHFLDSWNELLRHWRSGYMNMYHAWTNSVRRECYPVLRGSSYTKRAMPLKGKHYSIIKEKKIIQILSWIILLV